MTPESLSAIAAIAQAVAQFSASVVLITFLLYSLKLERDERIMRTSEYLSHLEKYHSSSIEEQHYLAQKE